MQWFIPYSFACKSNSPFVFISPFCNKSWWKSIIAVYFGNVCCNTCQSVCLCASYCHWWCWPVQIPTIGQRSERSVWKLFAIKIGPVGFHSSPRKLKLCHNRFFKVLNKFWTVKTLYHTTKASSKSAKNDQIFLEIWTSLSRCATMIRKIWFETENRIYRSLWDISRCNNNGKRKYESKWNTNKIQW